MELIKRYKLGVKLRADGMIGAHMSEDEAGEYAGWQDYCAVAARCGELEHERDTAWEGSLNKAAAERQAAANEIAGLAGEISRLNQLLEASAESLEQRTVRIAALERVLTRIGTASCTYFESSALTEMARNALAA